MEIGKGEIWESIIEKVREGYQRGQIGWKLTEGMRITKKI